MGQVLPLQFQSQGSSTSTWRVSPHHLTIFNLEGSTSTILLFHLHIYSSILPDFRLACSGDLFCAPGRGANFFTLKPRDSKELGTEVRSGVLKAITISASMACAFAAFKLTTPVVGLTNLQVSTSMTSAPWFLSYTQDCTPIRTGSSRPYGDVFTHHIRTLS